MRLLRLLRGVAVAGAAMLAGASGSAGSGHARWVMTDLQAGTLWDGTEAVAINERGQVIGNGCPPDGGCGEWHAFVWQSGRLRDLGTLGGSHSYTRAIGINDEGQVVGTSDIRTGAQHAFLWQDGHMRDLGTLGGKSSTATALNERGQVVGTSTLSRSPVKHAFLWQKGKLRDLAARTSRASGEAIAVNERGQVIGSGAGRGFRWENGEMTRLALLPGAIGSVASAIDDRGWVVGGLIGGVSHACLWQGGKVIDLGVLLTATEAAGKEQAARAVAINGHRQIVGYSAGRMLFSHAVLWTLRS